MPASGSLIDLRWITFWVKISKSCQSRSVVAKGALEGQRRTMSNVFVPVLFALVWVIGAFRAHAADRVDFARDVQPVLAKHCAECHGSDEQNGGLSFSDRESAFAEADSGSRAIVAGDLNASELYVRITTSNEDQQMPPEGDRLAQDQIDLIGKWIAEGADWPQTETKGSANAKAASSHWSFQPLTRPDAPDVHDKSWADGTLDKFIQASRERAGLEVAGDADSVVLIRRASYALTGLPPTPDEVTTFLEASDQRGVDRAFAELVDRLLGRPDYGERWGRHWMDWVRYADTAGDNSDFPIPQAYLYRNYIIDSFNRDLPYDRFLVEQLAGDLLPAETWEDRNRQTIATGYLAMARRFGSLVERYPWHLTIEDTIDNVGRTMMGLTLSCARCHDHKFDPISTRDYYGLYGFFASTQYPFPGIELFQTQHDLVPLVPPSEVSDAMRPYQDKTAKLERELEQLLAQCDQMAVNHAEKEGGATVAERRKMRGKLDALLIKARKAGEALSDHLKTIPPIPAAYAVQDGKPQSARIQIKGEPFRPGAEVPRKFPDILGAYQLADDVAASSSGRLELARWIASEKNPLTARVIVNRVWQRHFGTGLVASTSDFGERGEEPSHPELLDWLAGEFVRQGWSIKQLHRLIMNSRTYRLASEDVGANSQRDPGNRFYWRFNRQRLDAESIRDTLMMVAGTLDRTPQTEPYPIPPCKDWEYTQHHPFKDDYASDKRSVYQMTKRLTAKPYMQTFDGPDPNVCTSDRDQSVTALQALYFVNDEFLHSQAERFAASLVNRSGDDKSRINIAFSTILGREPTADESGLMLDHVASVRKKLKGTVSGETLAWSSLTRSLFRLNEFLYVD